MAKVQLQRAPDVRLNYNGMEFNGPLTQVWLEGNPVEDSSGRMTEFVLYRLHVTGVITYDRGGGTAQASPSASAEKNKGIKAPETSTPGSGSHILPTETADLRVGRDGFGGNARDTVRNRLLQQGGVLICTGHGFGDIFVNTSGGGRSADENLDVAWGPKPRSVTVKNLGGLNSVMEVDFVVEFCLGECWGGRPSGVSRSVPNLMSFTYGISYSVNQGGHTTRNVNGSLRVSVNREPVNSIDNNAPNLRRNVRPGAVADYARDYITQFMGNDFIDPAGGFRRSSQNYSISPDRSRIDFQFTDVEIESDNAYPIGISSASMSHTTSLQRESKGAFGKAHNRISGSFTAAAGFSAAHAWGRAYLVIRQRLMAARNDDQVFAILKSFSLTENIYAKSVSFDVSWVLTYKLSADPRKPRKKAELGRLLDPSITVGEVKDIFQGVMDEFAEQGREDAGEGDRERKKKEVAKSFFSYANFYEANGLFLQTEDRWIAWLNSMKANHSARGQRRLFFDSSTEQFFGLCKLPDRYSTGGAGEGTDQPVWYQPQAGFIGCDCPPPLKSYLTYEMQVVEGGVGQIMQIDALPQGNLRYESDIRDGMERNNPGSEYNYGRTRDYLDYNGNVISENVESESQQRYTTRYAPDTGEIWLIGYGERVCYNVQIPRFENVVDIRGKKYVVDKSTQSSYRVRRWQSGSMAGCPVYKAAWAFKLLKSNDKGINRYEANIADDSGRPLTEEEIKRLPGGGE